MSEAPGTPGARPRAPGPTTGDGTPPAHVADDLDTLFHAADHLPTAALREVLTTALGPRPPGRTRAERTLLRRRGDRLLSEIDSRLAARPLTPHERYESLRYQLLECCVNAMMQGPEQIPTVTVLLAQAAAGPIRPVLGAKLLAYSLGLAAYGTDAPDPACLQHAQKALAASRLVLPHTPVQALRAVRQLGSDPDKLDHLLRSYTFELLDAIDKDTRGKFSHPKTEPLRPDGRRYPTDHLRGAARTLRG